MALLVGLMLSGAVLYAIYKYVTSPEARAKFNTDVSKSPIDHFIIGVELVLMMGFLWGLLIPPFGRILIFGWPLWSMCGIGSLVWFVLFWGSLNK